MDADIKVINDDPAATADIKLRCIDLQSVRDFRVGQLANQAAVAVIAGATEQRQDLYLDLVKSCLDAVIKSRVPISGSAPYLDTQNVQQAMALAKVAYPIVKANFDLISQGQNPG